MEGVRQRARELSTTPEEAVVTEDPGQVRRRTWGSPGVVRISGQPPWRVNCSPPALDLLPCRPGEWEADTDVIGLQVR